MSSHQQQPRQWFRFGSVFQGAQQQQSRPPPPTTPTQQPALRPPARQPAQETPRAVGATIEIPVLRFPIKPAAVAVSTPTGTLPTSSRAATTTQIPQPTQIARTAGPQPKPLVFKPTPLAQIPPVPPAQPGGTSNEATIMRSVVVPMPPSTPALSLRSPQTSTPVSRSPPQPLPPTNGSTPYSTPMSRTPPSMQTSPSKGASPETMVIRFSSLPIPPVEKLPRPTSLMTSPVPEPPSPSRSPPPSLAFPPKSSNQDHTPIASPDYVNPVSEPIKSRQTSHPPISGNNHAEQKRILVQETLDRSRVHDQTFPEMTKTKNDVKEKGKTIPTKLPGSGKPGTRLILDGVNKGAMMVLNSGDKRESSTFRGNGKKLGSVVDDANKEKSNPNHKKGLCIQSTSRRAFINNNVQGINNSIVYNSSCKEKDPGVHLCLSIKGNVSKKDIQQKDQY